MEGVLTGIERVARDPSLLNGFGRCAVVANQACTTSSFESTVETLYKAVTKAQGSSLDVIFGPQHGYFQTEQDNMIETPNTTYTMLSNAEITLPLYSLYSNTREPTDQQMALIDTLVVDLLDIGCRIYTYMYTLAACMRAAARLGKTVVVLDRPNPLGLCQKDASGRWLRVSHILIFITYTVEVEGNVMDLTYQSFVGEFAIPIRHGLTLGELGQLFISLESLKLNYRVITVHGLRRSFNFADLSAYYSTRWTLPSPNMPSWLSCLFFPAYVAIEGTNVSEGRGSTLPFQLIGAPRFDAISFIRYIEKCKASCHAPHNSLASFSFALHRFRPTFNKHCKDECRGVFFHWVPSATAEPNILSLGIRFLLWCVTQHADWFQWKAPGYEYNFTQLPLMLILGSARWHELLPEKIAPQSVDALEKAEKKLEELLVWADGEAQAFAEKSRAAHLYT